MAFHRIVHHSLNPDNIIFGEPDYRGRLAIDQSAALARVAPILGETGDPRFENAARFASPEQLHANVVEVPSEIYSLGATMYFLLTGAPPDSALEVGPGTAGSLSAELGGVPRLVRRVLGKMLQPDPDKRPQDPVALALSCRAVSPEWSSREDRRASALPPQIADRVEKRPPLSLRQGRSRLRLRFLCGFGRRVCIAATFLCPLRSTGSHPLGDGRRRPAERDGRFA